MYEQCKMGAAAKRDHYSIRGESMRNECARAATLLALPAG
jgi:hypothetical protein